MRITEVARRTGATPDQIRYLERKRYITPQWASLKKRRVREYSESELLKIEFIVKYLRQGFKHEVAYQKALDELKQPRLV